MAWASLFSPCNSFPLSLPPPSPLQFLPTTQRPTDGPIFFFFWLWKKSLRILCAWTGFNVGRSCLRRPRVSFPRPIQVKICLGPTRRRRYFPHENWRKSKKRKEKQKWNVTASHFCLVGPDLLLFHFPDGMNSSCVLIHLKTHMEVFRLRIWVLDLNFKL